MIAHKFFLPHDHRKELDVLKLLREWEGEACSGYPFYFGGID